MKGKSVYWFVMLKLHECLVSRIAAHNTSFLQLDSVFFWIDHIFRQILCHAERPPEDAGLHSNQVHNPRGTGTVLLMASRVSGFALITSAWIIYYFFGDLCHGLGPHTVFKYSYFMGNGGAIYSRKSQMFSVHLPTSYGSVMCCSHLQSLWCVVLDINSPHYGVCSRGCSGLTSLE